MSVKTYSSISDRPVLRATSVLVKPYGMKQPLKPAGIASLTLDYQGRHLSTEFIVIDTRDPPLLGLDTCLRLGIVHIDAVGAVTADTNRIIEEYAEVFKGLGCLVGEYNITVDPSVRPVVQPTRKVPLNLRPKLKQLLDDLEQRGVIVKRTEPTDWVNALLLVEKKNGSLRVCMDPVPLNKAIKREHYTIPTFDDVVAHMHGKKLFTLIDMRDGFWQIQLNEASSKLCTFSTPFGRYSYKRLCMGISCAPEVFQRRNIEMFGDLPNVHVIYDDIIIAAADDTEHDTALRELFARAQRYNVRFNKDKLRLKQSSLRYFGHIVTADGIRADPDKVKAISDMPTPTDKKSLMRFLGMVTFLGRWLPHLADAKKPLCHLLRDEVDWNWSREQDDAVRNIKALLTKAPVLRFFDPSKQAVIQCDASSTGLGAVLLQDDQPCAYASRALSDAETRYSQSEKELLAICYAAEKFEYFIYGKKTLVHSDHRPLQAIFLKPISSTTPRLQRMLIRLARFHLEVKYKAGKTMYVSDALSRAYLPFVPNTRDIEMACDIDVTIHSLLYELPASNSRLDEIRQQTASCPELSQLRSFLLNGFPDRSPSWEITAYRDVAIEIMEADGLLLRSGRIIVPVSMRPAMLALIHEGHLGAEKSKARARQSLWWPGMARMIDVTVGACATCCANRRQQPPETLLPHPVPLYPWQKVGTDIFTYNRRDYLLVVDYFSKFPFVSLLPDKTASSVVSALKPLFSIEGSPMTVFADNMPFTSQTMRQFAKDWNFDIITSSPGYPRSNGQAERCVQTVKTLMKKAEESKADPHIALLNYRATPLSGSDKSPAELFHNRRLRTKLPILTSQLVPIHADKTREQLVDRQRVQKEYHDRHARDLPPLKPGDVVRVQQRDELTRGVVTAVHSSPRSYIVDTERGTTVRRNRRHLISTRESRPDTRPPVPVTSPDVTPATAPSTVVVDKPVTVNKSGIANKPTTVPDAQPKSVLRTTRSGRVVRPPVRFRDDSS